MINIRISPGATERTINREEEGGGARTARGTTKRSAQRKRERERKATIPFPLRRNRNEAENGGAE